MLRRVLISFLFTGSIAAFGQVIDPNIMVGPYGATCPMITNCSGEPNSITTAGFTLFQAGSASNPKPADVPWYIILAIPGSGTDDTDPGGTDTPPTISGTGFAISAGVEAGDMLQSTKNTSIYDIAETLSALSGLGLGGNNSLNAPNLFCGTTGQTSDQTSTTCTSSAEISAFGSEPDFFDIFVYTVTCPTTACSTGELTAGTNFDFTFGGTLPPFGTFVAGLGVGDNGNQQFSTPFTTSGLVDGTTGGNVQDTTGGVPEPSSIVLFGTVLLGLSAVLRKKLNRS